MDDRLAALARAFAGPWRSARSTCPLCGTSARATAPAVIVECEHFLARLVPYHYLVLLRGRSSFEHSKRLMPALVRLPGGSDLVSQLVRGGYHLGEEVVEPMLISASKLVTDTWPVECDLGRVVDLFVTDADKVIALVGEALEVVATRASQSSSSLISTIPTDHPRNANLTLDVTEPRIGDDHDE